MSLRRTCSPSHESSTLEGIGNFSDDKLQKWWTKTTQLFRLHSPNLKKYDEMPSFCRERHIRQAYRPNPSPVKYCITSALHPTNETLNFWTHFLPMLFLMSRHFNLSQTLNWDREDVKIISYPFWTYSMGCCVLLGCSSFAHMFNCVSARVRHICFCTDYGAISIYSVAGTIVYFYLVSPPHCHGFNEDHSEFYIPVATALAILSHVLCCHTRFPHVKARYLLRTLTYVMPFVVISTPTLLRLRDHVTIPTMEANYTKLQFSIIPVVGAEPAEVQSTAFSYVYDHQSNACPINESCIENKRLVQQQQETSTSDAEDNPKSAHLCGLAETTFPLYYTLHLMFFLVAAFFNVTRFPEQKFPGRFDVVGSSHQFFHMFIALGIIAQSVIVEEALLEAIEYSSAHKTLDSFDGVTAWSTLGWMSSVAVLLSVIVFIYSRALPSRH
ncbi:membrane progesterone receptor epsilon-like [Styela clava]